MTTSIEGGEGILRTYACFFAEFLNEVSPVHLGALTPAHLCRFSVRNPLDNIFQTFPGNLIFGAADYSASESNNPSKNFGCVI